jgi:putative lipoprotein
MKLACLPLLCLPLFALADAERLPYTCDNGSRIEISFSTPAEGRPQATLHFADSQLVLPQVPAASGVSYKQDGIGLHTKDEQAIFEDGKGNMRRCQLGQQAPAEPNVAPATSSFIDIQGSVTYLARIALPPDAVLTLRVQDRSRNGKSILTLSEQSIELNGLQVPVPFQITIDRDLLGKKSRPFITARIERKGKLLFIEDKVYPALPDGQPEAGEIRLKPAGKALKK